MLPERATVNPGTCRSASATVVTWRSRNSDPVITDTTDAAFDWGTSTCEADTTSDSDTAETVSAIDPTSREAGVASYATGSARKPSTATRSSYRPVSGASIENSPRASVADVRKEEPPETSSTRAAGTGRLSGSTTRPLIGPANAVPATRTDVTMKTKRQQDRYRMGLLLGVFARRCLLGGGGKGR